MKHFVIIFCTIPLLMSCKKDKLRDENSILIGRWNWVYSEHSFGWCNDAPEYETLLALSHDGSYSVEFLKRGYINFYENDKLVEKNRIIFNYFEHGTDGAFYFYFYLDNDLEKGMAGSIHGDTLHFDYPLMEENADCENYLNFLVRDNP